MVTQPAQAGTHVSDDEALRHRAERDGFLLALCDELRPLTDLVDVHAVSAARLGARLGADRVRWWELEPAGDLCPAHEDLGELPQAAIADLRAGRTVAADGDDARVVVPVLRAGEVHALLAVRRASAFAPDEVELAEAVAARAAAAADQARVVARARATGERLQLALAAARIGTFVWDPTADRTEADEQLLALLAAYPPVGAPLAARLEQLVHPDERDAVAAAIRAGLDPAGPGRMDRIVRLRDGDPDVTHLRVTWRATFAGDGAERRAVRVVGAVVDVSEQERARDELRRAAERDAFRVALTDALRATDRPGEMQQAAIELLRHRLGACRALVVEVDPADVTAVVTAQTSAGVPPLAASHRLADFGSVVTDAMHAGRRLVVDDVRTLDATDAERAALESLGVRSIATTAPVRDQAGTAHVVVHHLEPHPWTEDEVALVEEVAERLRAALQRARAETALRETGTRLQVAQDAARVAFVTWDLVADRTDYDERATAMLGDLAGVPLARALERAVHPDDHEPFLAAIRRARDPGTDGRYHHVLRVLRPGTPLAWIAVTGQVRFEGAGPERRAVHAVATLIDITDRVVAEQALRQATEQDRFLLALGDALRPLADPVAVQRAAARVLGSQVGASRAFYAEVSDEGWGRVREEHRIGVPSVVGRHRLDELGRWIFDDLRADHTVVVADVLADARVAPDEGRAYLERSVRAVVAVPLVKDGRLVALLGLHQSTPRAWTGQEVALAEETAERTWAAVERARAQSALHARHRPRRRG